MAEIGKRIRIKREELGITQEELASKMGYKNKSTIAKIENGTNDITQSKVCEFADILKTTPAYLMGWEDNASSDDTSDIVVELLSNNRLLEYVIKLNSLSDSKREKAYGYIDCLSEMEN